MKIEIPEGFVLTDCTVCGERHAPLRPCLPAWDGKDEGYGACGVLGCEDCK